MNLSIYVETLREHLLVAAEPGGSETKAVVERLTAGLEAATRLVLLETISAAADEITRELAPGAVEVRLRGSDPEFVVTLPSDQADRTGVDVFASRHTVVADMGDEGGTSRLNLRLPEGLKAKVEESARREGLSLNAWLVRAAAAAAEAQGPAYRRNVHGAQRYTGWVG
jgi:hypothetical protein